MLADFPRLKLTELVGRFGLGLSGDARRCKALLADACGEGYRGECAVLVGAVEEGIPGELLNNSSGMPKEMLLERLSRQLQSNRGFAADLARWAVECWAVALGVISGTDNLASFKMDGLAPLIDLAGADGAISTAELNHLLSEAKARGVSEADARAYLSKYAAARGWTIGPRPSPARKRTPPPSPPPPQPQARPQPSPGPAPAPAPPRTSPNAFRWAVGSIIGLVALGGVLIATVQHSSVPPSTAPTRSEQDRQRQAELDRQREVERQRQADAERQRQAELDRQRRQQQEADSQRQRAELADREQRAYYQAKGNLGSLRVYLNTCSICAFSGEARTEISRLETAEQEERTYNSARGNLYALRSYLSSCSVCAFQSAARSEVASLEASEAQRSTPPSTSGRYRKTACGSIIDGTSGLEWYLAPDTNVSWADTVEWVRRLGQCGGGWRMPTLAQLKGLFDPSVSAGTGYYTEGRYWPAHINPLFSDIGRGSWVWADGIINNSTAPAFNFNQGIGVRLSPSEMRYTVRAFAVKSAIDQPKPLKGRVTAVNSVSQFVVENQLITLYGVHDPTDRAEAHIRAFLKYIEGSRETLKKSLFVGCFG